MDSLSFVFETSSRDEQEILVAQLTELGFDGFLEENLILQAFISLEKFDAKAFEKYIEQNSIKYSKSIIKETNWNANWESGFQPVMVDHPITGEPFAFLRADFHEPFQGVVYDLLVTPKMSFGTGHHATTYLVVREMALLDFANKTVIDFGTGTGILAILAEKMGAREVLAIDNDEWSILNSRENLLANQCTHIEILRANEIPKKHQADIILANINLNIILANIEAITGACNKGASILLSGMLQTDLPIIMPVLEQAFLMIKDVHVKDNWIMIHAVFN